MDTIPTELLKEIFDIIVTNKDYATCIVLANVSKLFKNIIELHPIFEQIEPGLLCEYAADQGYLDVLKWARLSLRCEWSGKVLYYAASKIINADNDYSNDPYADIFRWAIINGYDDHIYVYDKLAIHGRLDLIKLADLYSIEWNDNIYNCAADGGYIDIWRTLRNIEMG